MNHEKRSNMDIIARNNPFESITDMQNNRTLSSVTMRDSPTWQSITVQLQGHEKQCITVHHGHVN